MSVGYGKVILLGEHAVVHGHPALAGALPFGVAAAARPAKMSRLLVDRWGIDTSADRDGSPARALAAILAAFPGEPAREILADAEVPARAGLGSSAALAVAMVRALGPHLGDAEVERRALAAEVIFHGNPSGIDVALATRRGMGLYTRQAGLSALDVPSVRLAVGLSGVPRDTAARVADVAQRLRERPKETAFALAELGELSLAGRSALVAAEPWRLGPLFVRAQQLLSALGVSSGVIEQLCVLARAAGAGGAKLTGAGGGGAVIAIGNEGKVVQAWQAAGFVAFVTDVGDRGEGS